MSLEHWKACRKWKAVVCWQCLLQKARRKKLRSNPILIRRKLNLLMKRIFIVIVLFTGIAIQSRSQDYTVIAKEYCDCFRKVKDTMDTEFRELMIRVAKQTDVKAAFIKEMNGLDLAKQSRLAGQLEALGTSMDS